MFCELCSQSEQSVGEPVKNYFTLRAGCGYFFSSAGTEINRQGGKYYAGETNYRATADANPYFALGWKRKRTANFGFFLGVSYWSSNRAFDYYLSDKTTYGNKSFLTINEIYGKIVNHTFSLEINWLFENKFCNVLLGILPSFTYREIRKIRQSSHKYEIIGSLVNYHYESVTGQSGYPVSVKVPDDSIIVDIGEFAASYPTEEKPFGIWLFPTIGLEREFTLAQTRMQLGIRYLGSPLRQVNGGLLYAAVNLGGKRKPVRTSK